MQLLRSYRVSSALKLLGGCDPSGQTAPPRWSDRPRRSDRPSWAVRPAWVAPLLVESSTAILFLNQVTQWFCGEPLKIPRTCVASRQPLTHDSAPTSSRLDLSFEAQPRNRPWLRLAVLATM
jgi:hypothetical protein